jgi:hypothetical protein
MPDTVSRIVPTLVGVLVGFLLSQLSEWCKSRSQAARRRSAVRRLIRLEANSNRDHIRDFWNTILARRNTWSDEAGEFPFVDLARETSKVPLPPLDIGAWQSNLGEVPSAYKEPEMEGLWRFQRSLKRIQALHCFFCEAASERRDSARHSQSEGGFSIAAFASGLGFADSVMIPAKEFKTLAEQVLAYEVPPA